MEEAANRGGIKNPAAYLMKAIQNDYRASEEVQNLLNEKTPVSSKKSVNESNVEDSNLEKVKELVKKLSAEEYAEYKERFLLYIQDNPIFKKFFEEKGFEHGVVQIQWYKFLEPLVL